MSIKDISNEPYHCQYKRQRKPKGQSTMDNPETLATLVTQDARRRQTKQKNYNDEQYEPHSKPGVNPGVHEW